MNPESKVFYLTQQYAGATLDALTAGIIHDAHHADQKRQGKKFSGVDAEKEASCLTVPIIKSLGLSPDTIRAYEYDCEHGHGPWGTTPPKKQEKKKKP